MLVTFILLGQPIFTSAECPDFSIFFKEIDPATKTWKILYRFYQGTRDAMMVHMARAMPTSVVFSTGKALGSLRWARPAELSMTHLF